VNQSQVQAAPALTVERFPQAANTRDLETMSCLFGTDDGPIADRRGREEVELRMDVIAEILQHVDYEIISERRVPGAETPSRRIGVDMFLRGGHDGAGCRLYRRARVSQSVAGQCDRGDEGHGRRVGDPARSGAVLHQFDQGAGGRFGMDKRYQVPSCAWAGFLVDELEPSSM